LRVIKIIFDYRRDLFVSIWFAIITALFWVAMIVSLIYVIIKQYKQGYISPSEMKTFLKKLKWIGIAAGIVFVIIGIMILVLPDA
jgi:hypothetical protein